MSEHACPMCGQPSPRPLNALGPFRIYIREQSDHYWLPQTFTTLDDAWKEYDSIKEGPLGGSFMVIIYAADGTQITTH